MQIKAQVALFCCIFCVGSMGAVEINMPALELATIGSIKNDSLVLNSTALTRISFSGGPKFGGRMEFGISSDAIESYFLNQKEIPLELSQLSFTSYRIFDTSLNITWFLGQGDTFCNGDSFSSWFEDAPVGSDYRGIQYFPSGINGNASIQYDGIYQVHGLGLMLANRLASHSILAAYIYQDSDFGYAVHVEDGSIQPGDPNSPLLFNNEHWSADLRYLFNSSFIKIEGFAGASFPGPAAGTWRGGLLAHFTAGSRAEFLLQAGIPRWDSDKTIKIDNFYFLFEPRVHFKNSSLHITVFYHPSWYRQQESQIKGQTDINTRFTLGSIKNSGMEGGLETTLYIIADTSQGKPLGLSINPFYSFLQSGVRWDFKLMIDPLNYHNIEQFTHLFVGLRTAF